MSATRQLFLALLGSLSAGLLSAQEARWSEAQGGNQPAAAPAGDWKESLDKAPDDLQTSVVKILRTTNKAQINRYVGKVYTFQHANPAEINNFFTSALMREEGAIYTFVPPQGPGGKILVICPAYQLPYFDELAKELDRPKITSAPGSKYIYKQLKHRSVMDASFYNVARQYASANAVLVADQETNALMIFDSPSGSDYCAGALDKFLDTPPPVVKVKVSVYEIAVNNDGSLGLDYEDYKNGPYQGMMVGSFNSSYVDAKSHTDSNITGSSRDAVTRRERSSGALFDLQYPSAFFDMLVEKGKATVVTQTELVTSSRKPASLFTGEQILYYSEVVNNTTLTRTVTGSQAKAETKTEIAADASKGLPPRHNAAGVIVTALDSGLRLDVFPVVGEQAIELDVTASVVSLLGFQDDGKPLLNSRSANTILTVKDGQEVTLGGMTRERQGRSAYKVPILGSIPVLGWLFGGETEIAQKTMLVMVIQPTIDKTFSGVGGAQTLIAEAEGRVKPTLPSASWGFDMFLFDSGQ